MNEGKKSTTYKKQSPDEVFLGKGKNGESLEVDVSG
jgi:hypothetical protein